MNTFYLTVEGGDGSGKTTLVKNLHQYFLDQGKKTLLTKEFGSTHDLFCKELREFALSNRFDINEEAGQILFAAIIKQHQEKVIKPAVGKFDIILSDRGPYSNYAYGPVHGLSDQFIKDLFGLAYRDGQWPTVSLFIHTPAELADRRRSERSPEVFSQGGIDRVEAKGLQFQKDIINNFVKISKEDDRLIVIDVSEDMNPQDVLAASIKAIEKYI